MKTSTTVLQKETEVREIMKLFRLFRTASKLEKSKMEEKAFLNYLF